MGFTLFAEVAGGNVQQKREDAVLHRLGCTVCPLNKFPGRMPATGADRPLIYCIGEAPGETEVREGEQFVGQSGELLRPLIPRVVRDRIRWNNVVRSHPPRNRTPEHIEIEACRPSVIADIEQSQPKAIFGFGNIPLHWVSGFSGITNWRGRHMPVFVGKHPCWFFPMFHPAYLLRQRRRGADVGSEEERMFRFDLSRAFDLVAQLPDAQPHTTADVTAGLEILMQPGQAMLDRLDGLLAMAAEAPATGIDYETNGLRPYPSPFLQPKILTAAVSTGDVTFAFPMDHPEAEWTVAHRKQMRELWANFLRTAKGPKYAHNLSFEQEWTAVEFGEELLRAGRWEDSAVQASVLDERTGNSKPGCFSLEFLVQQHFGFNLKQMSNLDRTNMAAEPLEPTLRYNGPDAKYSLLLGLKQGELIKEANLVEAYELSLRRVPTAVLTQIKGVPVNQAVVVELRDKYKERIEGIEAEIFKLPIVERFRKEMGRDFNPASNPDAVHVFDKMLKCKEVRVPDKYDPSAVRISVDVSVLSQIAKRQRLAQSILDFRTASKRKSTYIEPMLTGSPVLYSDGLLHAKFNTYFARTGRLSCDEPNLQNYPKRDEEAREVRRPISCKPGDIILAFDYGQIEARVIAMFTKDKAFCKALWEDYDVHMEWAIRLAKCYPPRIGGIENLANKKVMKAFRGDIKNQWTFPLFFGAQVESAAGYLDIPLDKVMPEYRVFWKQFSGVKEWQDKQLEFYQANGYVECLTSRRRHGPMSINQIINSPVQGTAAEIVLDAMCRLSETGDPALQPEINIHDDLTYLRVSEATMDEHVEKVLDIMLDVPFEWVNVPITVELSAGYDWMSLEEIAKFSTEDWWKKK